MEPGTPYDDKTRRIKSLLSGFYGTDEDTGSVQNESQVPNTDDVSSLASSYTPHFTSIDSQAFNAEGFASGLIRNSRIDSLLSTHGDLCKEIKALDSDMQMLVYENYNKFISATDTIRMMKKNVDGMGTNMEDLRSIIGEFYKPIGSDDQDGGCVYRPQQSGLCSWKILKLDGKFKGRILYFLPCRTPI